MNSFRKLYVALVFAVAGLAAFSGCAADALDPEAASETFSTDEDASEDVGTTAAAVYSGFTPYTSEELPPIVCDGVSAFGGVQCSGRYCDNIRADCRVGRGTRGASSWTSFFSEESTSYRYCGANQWVTGLACRGRYCDDISLQCTTISGVSPYGCYWTGWISEEGGGYLNFGAGYYARGAQCSGSNCDNKRFYVCRM